MSLDSPHWIVVGRLWDGSAAAPGEHVALALVAEPVSGQLRVKIDAPFHGDPTPPGPPGHTPGLWDFEVVELFLFGDDGRYLELEFGPHGHHLALELHGVRTVVRQVPGISYRSEVSGGRWRGEAEVDGALIPDGATRWNAHAIHGVGAARRYLSAHPARGQRPDFHRPDVSAPLDPAIVRALYLTAPAIRFMGQRIPLEAESVHSFGVDVTAEDLEALARLPRLARLSLNATHTTDELLALVGRLGGLEFLDLACTGITDAGLAHIGRLTGLKQLILKDNALTEAALPHLAPLTGLEMLHLGSMRLGDRGLELLGEFRALELLILGRPGLSREALQALMRRLPDCEFVVRGVSLPAP